MKLVQKILSHGLLIAFFVAVFFLYLYRQSLFPQWFGKPAPDVAQQESSESEAQTERAQQTPAPQPKPSSARPEPRGEITAGSADLPPLVTAQEPAPATDATPPDTSVPAASESADAALPTSPDTQLASRDLLQDIPPTVDEADEAAEDNQDVPPQYRSIEETVQEKPALAPVDAPPAGVSATTADTGSTQPMYRPEPTPRSDASGSSAPVQLSRRDDRRQATTAPASVEADAEFRGRLAQARETFWRRDMRGAVHAYRSLVEAYPAQADAWGELGNLYLTLGQRAVAADAYAQAIGVLIERGEAERARHLIRMLHGLDSGRASELEQRLRKTGS